MGKEGPINQSIKIQGKRFLSDSTLLFVAIIWGFAFVVQRIAAPQVGVFLFNAARFLLGALALVIVKSLITPKQSHFSNLSRPNQWWVILAGILLTAGAGFQQAGLQFTTAANAGFITGLYVVFIPVFLAVGFRQSPEFRIWFAAFLAAIGLFLLSTNGQLRLNTGDALVLLGSIFWALHVILIGHLVRKIDVLTLAIGQYVVCGFLNLLIGLGWEAGALPALISAWWTIVYTGLVSVALGYTLQIVGQRNAPPADAAIILSLEAVFAAVGGWIFLRESLSLIQILGCTLMMMGMLIAQMDIIRNRGEIKVNG